MFPRHLADFCQDLFPALCQVKRIQAPIIGVGSSFDQSSFLEIVENRYQTAGMYFEFRGQVLLAQSRLCPKYPKNAGIRRRQVKNSQFFSEL